MSDARTPAAERAAEIIADAERAGAQPRRNGNGKWISVVGAIVALSLGIAGYLVGYGRLSAQAEAHEKSIGRLDTTTERKADREMVVELKRENAAAHEKIEVKLDRIMEAVRAK